MTVRVLCNLSTDASWVKKMMICPELAYTGINSLPNDKILAQLELKGFADDKIHVTRKLKFVLGRVENIVGKGENAVYQHFLLFPKCFQKASYTVLIAW